MTMRLGALQDALMDPGNVEKATRAAEEVAGYDARLSAIETRLTLLTWMVGTNVGLTLIVLAKLLALR